MSCRLRYYKSDDVLFKPLAVMVSQDDYVNLATDQFALAFPTLKEAIKFLATSDGIKQVIDSFDKDPSIVIAMVKDTAIVDDYKLLGNGDTDNVLHYCQSATIFLDSSFKGSTATFTFANMPDNSEFKFGQWFSQDNSFRIGSGAKDAYAYFENECPNRELADFITSKITPCRVLW